MGNLSTLIFQPDLLIGLSRKIGREQRKKKLKGRAESRSRLVINDWLIDFSWCWTLGSVIYRVGKKKSVDHTHESTPYSEEESCLYSECPMGDRDRQTPPPPSACPYRWQGVAAPVVALWAVSVTGCPCSPCPLSPLCKLPLLHNAEGHFSPKCVQHERGQGSKRRFALFNSLFAREVLDAEINTGWGDYDSRTEDQGSVLK